jgi:hypothetical protein
MPFNTNQTNFEHTFQAKVTFLSNTFFGGEGIDISKNTKLDVNGTANFFGKSVFADVDVKNLNITSGANITGLTTFNNIDIDGELRDGDGSFGSSGQVLSSDGVDTKWVNAGSLSAGVAANVSVSDDGDSNASRFVTFVDAASGSNAIKTDASIKYNPDSNQLSAGSFSGSIDASNVNSGTLSADRIPNLNANKINAGTLGSDRIPNLDASKINAGTLGTGRIPNLDAGKITTGTLGAARIPNLDAGKITTGTLGDTRIPSLNASKINAGTFGSARIPDLDANKISTGTLDDARIPNLNASKINAGTLDDARIPNLNASKINAGTLGSDRIPNLSGAKITTGTVAVARLGSGTPSSSNFLRGDGAWTSITFPDGDKIAEGNTEAEVVDTGTNGHFKVTTEGNERIRVGPSGQIGIAGANYGTSGQVLKSQGAGAGVQWGSVGMSHSNKTSSYTLTASDDNRLITTTSNVTIPSGVFSVANGTTIYNNSSSTISIVQGSGVTLRLSGSNITGTRSLVQRGVCTVMCVASNQFIITGSGLA